MKRAELVETLELVKPALATDNVVAIFQCFTFANGTVAAYNDNIAIVGPTKLDEACGIHGATLLGLLSNSSAEEVEFSFDETTATLKLGKNISKLPFQNDDNFIFTEPTDKWAHKVVLSQSLAEAIKMCLETVSNDTTQAGLMGVTLSGDHLYSCNGDALTRVHLNQGIKSRVLMSTQFCSAVLKLWATVPITKASLHFSDEWVFADLGDWSVYGRVIPITDPLDFEALIKRGLKNKTPTQALPVDFSEALSRARVLADPESQKTVVSISKGKLELLTETHMGEVKDTLIMKGHPDVKAHVNASYLQRATEYCDQIAFLNNCTLLEKAPDVLLIVSNMA